MKIDLWYSQTQRQWRGSLCKDTDKMSQESGQRPFLRNAMDGVPQRIIDKQLALFEQISPDYAQGVKAAL